MVFLNQKVTHQSPDYLTYVGAGVIKSIEERALIPLVGNGTLVSAGVKGVVGYGIHAFGGSGKIQDMASMAFTMDAVEDFVNVLFNGNLLSGVLGGGNATAENW